MGDSQYLPTCYVRILLSLVFSAMLHTHIRCTIQWPTLVMHHLSRACIFRQNGNHSAPFKNTLWKNTHASFSFIFCFICISHLALSQAIVVIEKYLSNYIFYCIFTYFFCGLSQEHYHILNNARSYVMLTLVIIIKTDFLCYSLCYRSVDSTEILKRQSNYPIFAMASVAVTSSLKSIVWRQLLIYL